MFNVDYNGQKGNKHLQFLSQAAPSAEKHHVIGDWEVTRQSGATLNYSGVDSIQTLVAKKRVVPPVFLDIIWKKKATVFALHHDLSLHPRHHSGWGYNKNISQCFCVIVVLNMSVVLLVKTLRIASMLDQFCLQSESPFSLSSVSLGHIKFKKQHTQHHCNGLYF